MNNFSPLTRQLVVASAPQLAALSVGGIIGYPNVILEQLKSDDSSIQLEFDMASWIGSVHGLAGILSIFMPTIMHWRGRKITFIICCLLIISGWILTYISTNVTGIIIAESFHGFGSNSIVIVSFFTVSEMVDPKFRIMSMNLYFVNHSIGIALVCIMGRFVHWRTVSLVMSIPIVMALLIGCVWPESPSWLAWKGDFKKCAEAFTWLRGTDEDSNKELSALLNTQNKHSKSLEKQNEGLLKDLWLKIKQRDFYLPCIHMFVYLSLFYCSGTLVVIIYVMDVIRKTTGNENAAFYGMVAIDVILALGNLVSVLLMKKFRNKTILLISGGASAIFLFLVSFISLMQSVDLLPKHSMLGSYCLIGFMIACSMGTISLSFTVSAELVPVKHRAVGGALYVILTCSLHFVSLKVSPYMMLYLDIWGTFLIFSVNAFLCVWYIMQCVPETQNRTLPEIEYFYNHGYFYNRHNSRHVEDSELMCKINVK